MKIKELIIEPQSQHGIDWGRPRKLLVKSGSKSFFQVPGHTGWSGVGRLSYYNTKYTLYERGGRVLGRDIHSGRLNKAALSALTAKLEEFFGATGFVQHISLKHTICLDEN